MGLGVRLVYFAALGLLNWLQVIAAGGLVRPASSRSTAGPIVGRMALVGLAGRRAGHGRDHPDQCLAGAADPALGAASIFPENAFLTIVISVVIGLFVEQRLRADADASARASRRCRRPDAPATAAPDFFRRIPPALGRDLLALEMEDHYLRIHTALGSDLILLRLRDALAELGTGARPSGASLVVGGRRRGRVGRAHCRPARADAAQRPQRAGQQDVPRPGQGSGLARLIISRLREPVHPDVTSRCV